MLLNSHHDPSTGLTYIDTPGFNNVSGDDDTTIDAANSAGNTNPTLKFPHNVFIKEP